MIHTWEEASRILHKICAYFSPYNVYSTVSVHTGIVFFDDCMRHKSVALNSYHCEALFPPCMSHIFNLEHKECKLSSLHKRNIWVFHTQVLALFVAITHVLPGLAVSLSELEQDYQLLNCLCKPTCSEP